MADESCTQWNIPLDARDMLHIKEHASKKSLALPPAGQGFKPFLMTIPSVAGEDLFGVILGNKQYQAIGRALAKLWRKETGNGRTEQARSIRRRRVKV